MNGSGGQAPAVRSPRAFARGPRLLASVRFRLTVLYSTLLFTLAALVVTGLYLAVRRDVGGPPLLQPVSGLVAVRLRDGSFKPVPVTLAAAQDLEQAVDAQTLEALRRYSLLTLLALFLASLAIGWVLSGRALRPVRQIAESARHISATDLSRRIRLQGPDDEFHYLADTLDSMLARLDEAFRAQRRMLDDASHELRTPLAVITANVEGVLLDEEATPEERRGAAQVVLRAALRMNRLVDDLLAAARRSAPAFADREVDLGEVAREAGEEFTPLAERRRIGLRFAAEPGTAVAGDPDGLRRAVANLLSNALRLAPAGSEVLVGAGRWDDWCWVAVRDAGPGIAAEQQGRVFDRFWRGTEGREQGGEQHTGLGLSIVRQIVEGHSGHVRLHSRPGTGSTFVLWLPAARTGGGPGGPPAEDPLAAPAPAPTGPA